MAFTDYFEEKLLEHAFSGVPYTPPATWYVTLFSVAPSDTTAGTEVAGTEWGGRKAISFGQYVAASSGVPNSAQVAFTVPAGNVVAVGLMDAQAAGTGNLCSYKTFATKTYTAGETVLIDVGALIQTLD